VLLFIESTSERQITVFMQSDDYGREEFQYESIDDAIEGMRRLVECASRDNVRREIGIVVGGV
jgi:hypothetical protein